LLETPNESAVHRKGDNVLLFAGFVTIKFNNFLLKDTIFFQENQQK